MAGRNPGQLWETTLDTNEHSLLRVKIKEVDDADDIFTKLMGDVVEPRSEFTRTIRSAPMWMCEF
jgi:DNA gyrase subunit B